MRDFSQYDQRNYETTSVVDGYAEWSKIYDATMFDMMDQTLLVRLDLEWRGPAIDLACGTGRVGLWLNARGVEPLDGVDITPEMIVQAKEKGVYRRLELADVVDTGLDGGYAFAIQVLACEHVRDLDALYREARRLSDTFVIVGYHPFFMLKGVPTHFKRPNGENLAIDQYVHLLSDHVGSATRAGFRLAQLEEAVVDADWVEAKPNWKRHEGWPVTFAMVWRCSAG